MRSPLPPAHVLERTNQYPGKTGKEKHGRLPLFSYGLFLYGFGLVTSAWLAYGNVLRVFWLAVGFLLFWLVVAIGRKTTYLYYLVLGFTTFLMLVGWLCAGNFDDDYLRSNFISEKVLNLDWSISPRLPGLVMHRNTLAGMLAVIGVLALNYGLFSRQVWVRWLSRVNSLSMFALLLVSNSRGGLVAYMSGVLLLLVLNLVGNGKKGYRYILAWGLGLLGMTGVYLVASGQYQLFTFERLLNENGISRLEIWKNTFYMLGDVPLTGFGPGNFEAVYPFYIDPSPVSGRVSQEHAHNIFLQIYGETGIAGFLGILTIFARLIWLFKSAFQQKELFTASPDPSPDQNTRAVVLGRGGLAASITMFIFGFTEFNPWNEQFTFLFWFPLALVAAVYTRNRPGQLYPRFSLPKVARWFKKRDVIAKLTLIGGSFIISGLILWQMSGLGTVNMAGLASEQTWRGTGNSQPDKIEKLYQAAEESVGWTGVPRRGEAWVAWMRNDTGRAEQLLREVIYNQPGDRRSLLMLGDLVAARGNKVEAVSLWSKAGAAPLFVDRGRQFLDTKDDLRSEPYFLEAIEIDPYLWDGYRFLVMLYQRHGRTDEAVALLEKARPFFPGDPRLQNELKALKPAS